MHNKTPLQGFTLIEMSIVLVIIGFIVGGVIAGQSLIRQSEISSALSDEQKYISAVANFQQKYGALPGDFASATSYWTAAGTCPPTNASPATSTTTCSGDGNGQVGTSGTTTIASSENFLFWQHLDLAQMIPGSYNGTTGGGSTDTFFTTGTNDHLIGKNSPATKLDGTGFGVSWIGVVTASTAGTTYPASAFPSNSLGHVFVLGAYNSNNLPASAGMTGAEAAAIDQRYDDGSPSTGNIENWLTTATSANYAASCASGATTYTTTAGYQCSLIFVTGF